EGDGGDRPLVIVDLAVGQTGVVVEGGVDEGVADLPAFRPGRPGRCAPAVSPPATAGRDLGEFLDVDVDQVTGTGVLVAANGPPAGAVHVRQPVGVMTAEHGIDRRGGEFETAGDPSRSELLPA